MNYDKVIEAMARAIRDDDKCGLGGPNGIVFCNDPVLDKRDAFEDCVCISGAQAALQAVTDAGCAVVPLQPTEAQVDAFIERTVWDYDGSIRDGYKAMLEAAK